MQTSDFYSPSFVGPSDMEDERSKIRRGMMKRGIFRMQVDRNGRVSIPQQVVATYAQNPSLHKLDMKIKFSVEQGQDGGGLTRELVGCFWDELACKHMVAGRKFQYLGLVKESIISKLDDSFRTVTFLPAIFPYVSPVFLQKHSHVGKAPSLTMSYFPHLQLR